ncbi:MAG: hypothetical protein ABL961_05855 [Vicinamibacterales bacterium]
MMRPLVLCSRGRCGLVLALLLLCAPVRQLFAQEPAAPPDMAVALADTPMYWLKDTSRTPIRVLETGSHVRIVRREGNWYRVTYSDPRFGDETGYVQAASLRGDNSAAGLSTSPSGRLSQRGFIDARAVGFPQSTVVDDQSVVADFLVRDDVFLKPARWLQFAAGADIRANSHDQVEDKWRVDTSARGVLRPRVSLRRLAMAITTNHVTLDIGRQFIRWGRADILNPTDRFAPRDFLNVLDTEYLPVQGVRSAFQFGSESFEVVWLPSMTPSRLPLIDQRWTAVPPGIAPGLTIRDRGAVFPDGGEQGARWLHSGRFDLGASFFDGFNHLPDIDATVDPLAQSLDLTRSYAPLRTYGLELSLPTSAVTVKGEASWFTSPNSTGEEYVLYVLELERQIGEWVLDGGYVGELVTQSRPGATFGAERGIGRSFIGRASYTAGPRRSVGIEGAARQNGEGFYLKGEYSEALSPHWRLTISGVGLGGQETDFIGQYRRNSHASTSLRLSF